MFLKEDTKTFQYARELEKFFDMQLKKWLPKYAKSVITTPQQHKSYNMCDFIDDGMIDDPADEDFVPKNGAKRPRSTPSVWNVVRSDDDIGWDYNTIITNMSMLEIECKPYSMADYCTVELLDS